MALYAVSRSKSLCNLALVLILILGLHPGSLSLSWDDENDSPEDNCPPIPPPVKAISNVSLSNILSSGIEEMKEAREVSSLSEGFKNRSAIFILGNTGSGKTTLAKITIGDLSRLQATRTKAGQLVIIDDDNQIGAPTTESKTLVPIFLTHPETGDAFWDCPGFDDNRGIDKDIAAMYFVKYALDTTNWAKFIFTVPHGSVKAGYNRNDFDLLATHAVRLLGNVTRLRDSIGLVVTKVDGYQGGKRLKDKRIIMGIQEFLAKYIQTKTEELQTTSDEKKRKEIQSKIDFVHGIIGNDNTDGRLLFSRSPEKCGPLDEMEPVLKTRKKVTELYSKTLQYSLVTSSDFQFSVKAETLHEVETKFIPETKFKMGENFKKIVNDMEKDFKTKFYHSVDANNSESRMPILPVADEAVKSYIDGLSAHQYENAWNNEFSESLKNLSTHIGINISQTLFTQLSELERQLRFYDNITNNQMRVKIPDPNWLLPLQNFSQQLSQLSQLNTFYQFCTEVNTELQKKEARLVKLAKGSNLMNSISNGTVLQFLFNQKIISVPADILAFWEVAEEEEKEYLSNLVRQILDSITYKYENYNQTQSSASLVVKPLLSLASEWEPRLKNILIDPSYPENASIFVLGNSDAVSSRAIQLITGDLSKLSAAYSESGDLIINDNVNGEDRKDFIDSFPGYVLDGENKIAFWKFRGFEEDTSPEDDIVTVHITKKILESSQSAKLLFTISFPSMPWTIENSQRELDTLVTNAVRVLGNFSLNVLTDSIGLVVTDVQSYSTDSTNYQTDNLIMHQIEQVFNLYVNSSEEKLLQASDENKITVLQRKIDFVQLFLSNDGNRKPVKISFLRSPSKSGALLNMPELVESISSTVDLHSHVLTASPSLPTYLSISVNEKTFHQVETKFIPETKLKTEENFKKIVNDMEEDFKTEFYHSLDANNSESRMPTLSVADEAVKSYIDGLSAHQYENAWNNEFSESLKNLSTQIGFNISQTLFTQLTELERKLRFYDNITNNQMRVKIPDPSWLLPLQNFSQQLSQLSQLNTFYQFCTEVNTELQKKEARLVKLAKGSNLMNSISNGTLLQFLSSQKIISVPIGILAFWEVAEEEEKEYLSNLVRQILDSITYKHENHNPTQSSASLVVKPLLSLTSEWEQRLQNILIDPSYPGNASIFVLGNSDAVNTRAIQLITGDLSKLSAAYLESGDLIMDDKVNKEREDFIDSFPGYVLDGENNIAFWKFRGFEEDTSPEDDIVTVHITKKILESSQSAQLLFTISFPSMPWTIENSQRELDTLATNAVRVLGNSSFNTLAGSIGLVVTDVQSYSTDSSNYKTDEEIMHKIEQVFKLYITSSEQKLTQISNANLKTIIQCKINFVQLFLPDNQNRKPVIVFFLRSPSKRGTLVEMPEIVQSINNAVNLYRNVITTSPLLPKELQILVNDDTCSKIKNVFQPGYVTKIKELTRNVADQMKRKFLSRVAGDWTVNSMQFLNTTESSLSSFIMNKNWQQSYSGQVSDLYDNLNFTKNYNILGQIVLEEKKMQLFTIVSNGKIKVKNMYPEWISAFAVFTSHVTAKLDSIKNDFLPNTAEKINEHVKKMTESIYLKFHEIVFINALAKGREEVLKYIQDSISKLAPYLRNFNDSRQCTTVEMENICRFFLGDSKCHTVKQTNYMELKEDQFKIAKSITGQNAAYVNLGDASMHKFVSKIEDLQTFFQLCVNVEFELLKYDQQIKLKNVTESTSGSQDNSETLNFLKSNNLFSPSISKLNLWNRTDSDEKQYFAELVHALIPKLEAQCVEYTYKNEKKRRLTFTGKTIFLSEALDKTNWPVECRNKVRQFSIVAMEKVFLNADISEHDMDVSIVAPKWQLVPSTGSSRLINLCGRHGEEWGSDSGYGKDGRTGGNAGSFFGVYSQMENLDQLQITADGGNGGPGQPGKNGDDCCDGKNASIFQFPDASRWNKIGEGMTMGHFVVGKFITTQFTVGGGTSYQYWTLFGAEGGKGRSGGKGGNGGSPGIPGTIKLIRVMEGGGSLEKPPTKLGKVGVGGKGGLGGRGGKHGNSYSCAIVKMRDKFPAWDNCKENYNETRSASGSNGNDGFPGNLSSAQEPNFYHDPWQGILEYKRQFLSSHPSFVQRNFFKELEFNPEIYKIMNSQSYAVEAETLERQWMSTFGINFRANGVPLSQYKYYQNFLVRLTNHKKSLKEKSSLTQEDKAVLSVVYSTVLSKIVGMRRTESTLNVVKTKNYFDSLVDQLNSLKEKQNVAIQKERINFKAKLDVKMKEAETLIKETGQPAIQNAHNAMKIINQKLLAELNEYLRTADKDLGKKRQMKRNFASMMVLNALLSIVDTVGSLTKFLGPKGAAVGAVMSGDNGGISLARSFTNRKRRSTTVLSSPGIALEWTSLEYYQIKIESIERQLNLTIEAGNMAGDKMQNVMGAAIEAKTNLTAFKLSVEGANGAVNLADIFETENKLDQSIRQLRDSTSKTLEDVLVNLPEENAEDAQISSSRTIRACKYIEGAMSVGITLKGLYDDGSKSISEIDELNELVSDAEEKLKEMERKKTEFFDDFLPHLKSISKDIQQQSSNLGGQSHAGLSEKQWKMNGLIKKLRKHVLQFAKENRKVEEFQLGFDALDEALILLIDMYDHIERYHEKKELADFIVNVNGAGGTKSQITDTETKETIERLEYYIHVNLFMVEYQRALHAFKQWVFPFASHYLSGKNENLAESFSPTSSITEVANAYIERVKGLQGVLETYNSATVKGGEAQMVGPFTSNAVSAKPFYVWKNVKWQGSIRKMLQGRKIQLKADVDMSGNGVNVESFFRQKSAIKFKNITLELKVKNSSRQEELNVKLDHFKIKMIHSGISVYKVLGQQYVMFDKNQTYIYSFELIGNERVAQNLVAKKLSGSDADYLMSPYTWWTFQLIDSTPDEGYGFGDLQEFAQEIDLELQGTGVYLDESLASENTLNGLNLDDHYEVYDAEGDNEK